MRILNLADQCLTELDTALRTLLPPQKRQSNRASPAVMINDCQLSKAEKKHIAGLMRVNHSGEVCAQGLYQGQALTAKCPKTRKKMAQAAEEEVDHLAWCEQRLNELHSQPSLLNPFWYTGSFLIGAIAGIAGDKYSLGFVAETEKQVSKHLQKHLDQLPKQDKKTKAILKQMDEDETQHAEMAIQAGAVELPFFIRKLMGITSKLMTNSSYHL